jgi:hypothetical protein
MDPKAATFAELLNSWSTFGTFLIAVASLVIAVIALRRTMKHERPYASLQLDPVNSEYFRAVLTINNPSRLTIKIEKLFIELPDFRWAQVPESMEAKWQFESLIGGPVPNGPVLLKPGESADVNFVIFQPAHSRKKKASMIAHYFTMEAVPKWRSVNASASTRSSI